MHVHCGGLENCAVWILQNNSPRSENVAAVRARRHSLVLEYVGDQFVISAEVGKDAQG